MEIGLSSVRMITYVINIYFVIQVNQLAKRRENKMDMNLFAEKVIEILANIDAKLATLENHLYCRSNENNIEIEAQSIPDDKEEIPKSEGEEITLDVLEKYLIKNFRKLGSSPGVTAILSDTCGREIKSIRAIPESKIASVYEVCKDKLERTGKKNEEPSELY